MEVDEDDLAGEGDTPAPKSAYVFAVEPEATDGREGAKGDGEAVPVTPEQSQREKDWAAKEAARETEREKVKAALKRKRTEEELAKHRYPPLGRLRSRFTDRYMTPPPPEPVEEVTYGLIPEGPLKVPPPPAGLVVAEETEGSSSSPGSAKEKREAKEKKEGQGGGGLLNGLAGLSAVPATGIPTNGTSSAPLSGAGLGYGSPGWGGPSTPSNTGAKGKWKEREGGPPSFNGGSVSAGAGLSSKGKGKMKALKPHLVTGPAGDGPSGPTKEAKGKGKQTEADIEWGKEKRFIKEWKEKKKAAAAATSQSQSQSQPRSQSETQTQSQETDGKGSERGKGKEGETTIRVKKFIPAKIPRAVELVFQEWEASLVKEDAPTPTPPTASASVFERAKVAEARSGSPSQVKTQLVNGSRGNVVAQAETAKTKAAANREESGWTALVDAEAVMSLDGVADAGKKMDVDEVRDGDEMMVDALV
jgi:hypothetical protein